MFRAATDTQGFKGAMTMAKLAQFFSGRLDRPVQDFTGLNGTYDIDLSWAPDPTIDRPPSATSYSAAQAASGEMSIDLPRSCSHPIYCHPGLAGVETGAPQSAGRNADD
jgi:uncharacterized protein (TIGR03435 family)